MSASPSTADTLTVSASGVLKASIIRTLVPYIVGGLLAVAVRLGLHFDPAAEEALGVWITQGLGVVLGTLYYLLGRWLERIDPRLGLMLGLAKVPAAYSAPDKASTEVDATPVPDDYEPKHSS